MPRGRRSSGAETCSGPEVTVDVPPADEVACSRKRKPNSQVSEVSFFFAMYVGCAAHQPLWYTSDFFVAGEEDKKDPLGGKRLPGTGKRCLACIGWLMWSEQSPEADSSVSKPSKVISRSPAVPFCPLPPMAFAAVRPFTCVSWNVNGLRAVVKKWLPELHHFVERFKPDLLCLQETKLQQTHVADFDMLLPGYVSHWNCSQTKKGYSGTAVFVRQHAPPSTRGKITAFTQSASAPAALSPPPSAVTLPLGVTFGMSNQKYDDEGRCITIEYPHFYVVNLYVPNAGAFWLCQQRVSQELCFHSFLSRQIRARVGAP